MSSWIKAALEYADGWLDYQVRQAALPGLQYAISAGGRLVAEGAFGKPALSTDEALSPDHVFRVASHSKTFTAVGIMRLVEAGRLRLDDRVGRFVSGTHEQTAQTTIGQLLTHTAGVTRDSADAGQWQLRRPFLDQAELRATLAQAPVLTANTRFKYSNIGFGLLGLIIERVTGESYRDWMAREVVARAGLGRTAPDAPAAPHLRLAQGHGVRALFGRPFGIDVDMPTGALASATGFVSTAGDLATFFAQLAPNAPSDLLDPASRREMTRRLWRVPDMSIERHYGLGLIHGGEGEAAWYGHSGVFPGCLSHTGVLPALGVTISVIVNSVELQPALLVDGIAAILCACREGGSPGVAAAKWSGRWWSLWTAVDLVPMAGKVVVANTSQINPMLDAVELTRLDERSARVTKAGGFLSYGEPARLTLDQSGEPRELWLGGFKLLREADLAAEAREKFPSLSP